MNKKLSVMRSACFIALSLPMLAMAANIAAAVAEMAEAPAAAEADAATVGAAGAPIATVEISTRKTRSSVEMSKSDMQKILPGINPLKALQTLPSALRIISCSCLPCSQIK